jgi:multiple sugar transport system substrate-binding protein
MRFFAAQGLVGEIGDVWARIGHLYGEGFLTASSGADGGVYFVPMYTYPWVVLHRRSVWDERGYTVPTTLEDLRTLADRMRGDGLVPFAFGNREGWPAMGTFDIVDMRRNGYDFHIGLLAGRERWTDDRVKAVFELWRDLLPLHQEAAPGRTWQEAARAMVAGEAGMLFLGTFAGEQAQGADRDDLDFFPFPLLGTAYDDEAAIDAPINGFMMPAQPRNPAGAKAFLEFVGHGAAQDVYIRTNPNYVAAAIDADTSAYTPYQQKMVSVIRGARRVAQFLDRDTRPDFAGPAGLQNFLQSFLNDPDQDLGPFLASIQAHWDSLT